MIEQTEATAMDHVIDRIRNTYRAWRRETSVEQMRKDWDALFPPSTMPVGREDIRIGELRARWIGAPGANPGKATVYFHGGGYKLGSLDSHDELMANISAATGGRVLGVDYRLAPEHRFPAALEDALAAYRWLLREGRHPSSIAFAGDSAGAGLALAALVALRDAGEPLPAAVVAMSAWTDLTASGSSYVTRAAEDPIHQRPMIFATARNYIGDVVDPCDARVSPLFADLAGLPPLLLQAGSRETVLDDSTAFAAKARAAGVDVELQVWKGMIHVFQMFPTELAEAGRAIAEIGDFIRRHVRAN